jgi:hypothetical protein
MIDFDIALAKTKDIEVRDVTFTIGGKTYLWNEKNILVDLKMQQMYSKIVEQFGEEKDWPVDVKWNYFKDIFYLKYGKEEVDSWWNLPGFDDHYFFGMVIAIMDDATQAQIEFMEKMKELPLAESPAEPKKSTRKTQ